MTKHKTFFWYRSQDSRIATSNSSRKANNNNNNNNNNKNCGMNSKTLPSLVARSCTTLYGPNKGVPSNSHKGEIAAIVSVRAEERSTLSGKTDRGQPRRLIIVNRHVKHTQTIAAFPTLGCRTVNTHSLLFEWPQSL